MPEDIENKDGSAVVETPEDKSEEQIEIVEEGAQEQQASEQKDSDDSDEALTAEEEEQLRLAKEKRRASRERREKQKLARDSDKARIASQEHTIRELTERLSKIENTQESMRISRMDGAIERQENLIVAIKQKIATTEDRLEHSDLIDRLADEKLKLRDLQSQKKLAVESVKNPKTTVPDAKRSRTDHLMNDWMSRTPWFDPQGGGIDTRIATVIDEELVKEGWNPATEEYWDELDARLAERLPHRYKQQARRTAPVSSTRNESQAVSRSNLNSNQFYISKERKQALIDLGVWDDPEQRLRYIKQYQKFDRENMQ